MDATRIAEAIFWCVGVPGLMLLSTLAFIKWRDVRRGN